MGELASSPAASTNHRQVRERSALGRPGLGIAWKRDGDSAAWAKCQACTTCTRSQRTSPSFTRIKLIFFFGEIMEGKHENVCENQKRQSDEFRVATYFIFSKLQSFPELFWKNQSETCLCFCMVHKSLSSSMEARFSIQSVAFGYKECFRSTQLLKANTCTWAIDLLNTITYVFEVCNTFIRFGF